MRKLPNKCTNVGLHAARSVSISISFVVTFVIKTLEIINSAEVSHVETTQRICGMGLNTSFISGEQ